MDQLSLGMFGTSRKENNASCRSTRFISTGSERSRLRARIFLECGYGERFGMTDAQLAPMVAGLRPRQQLIAECDVIVLPKPTGHDIAELREGQVLWGWPALRPGQRRHPAGHRPPADPDHLGGDELLDR